MGITRILLGILLCIFGNLFLNGQQNTYYELDWQKEPIYLGIGVGTSVASLLLDSQLEGLSKEEVAALNRDDLWSVNQGATYHKAGWAVNASHVFMFGSAGLPGLFVFDKKHKTERFNIAVMYTEVFTITSGLTILTKSLTLRPRPFVYNEKFSLESKLEKDARHSFFSGHTSVAAASCFFTAKVYSDLYPDSKWKPLVWGLAATIPAATAYFRMKGGRHFPTDVAVGYGVGALVGILVPVWHKKDRNNVLGIQWFSTGNGIAMQMNF